MTRNQSAAIYWDLAHIPSTRSGPQKRLNNCLLMKHRSFLWELTERKDFLESVSLMWFTGLGECKYILTYWLYARQKKKISPRTAILEKRSPGLLCCRQGLASTVCWQAVGLRLCGHEEDIDCGASPGIKFFHHQSIDWLQPILSEHVAAHTETGSIN